MSLRFNARLNTIESNGNPNIVIEGGVQEADVGLTANVGSAQGNGVITSFYNVYSTVATTGDAATLQSTFPIGTIVYVKNDGANSMDVFPASGDDAGAGANVAIAVAAGESATFIATAANATWTELLSFGGGGVPDPLLLGDGSAGAPTYSFTNSPTTGIYRSAADRLAFAVAGVGKFQFRGNFFETFAGNSPMMMNETVSATNPGFVPHSGAPSSGIGAAAAGEVTIIATALEGSTWIPFNGGVTQTHACDKTITAFAGGGIGAATVLKQSYNIVTTVATTGDSVRLPSQYAVNTIVYIKNDGANSLDVFPNNAFDNLGQGDGNAEALAVGDSVAYIATATSSTWTPFMKNSAVVIPDPLLLGAGSVGAPSYSFAGDPDTGVYNVSADILGLTAGGVQVAKLTEASGIVQFIVPQQNNAGLPSLAFGDGNTGFYESGDNTLITTIAGIARWQMDGNNFSGFVSEAPRLINAAGSATVPNIVLSKGDLNTGFGHPSADQISLIAGGVEGIRLAELNSAIKITIQTTVGLTAFAGGGQGSATQLQGSYSVVSTVATTGDSVKLPGVLVGTQAHVKNDGANAMDVFPLSGDDLGAGTDTAVSVAAGASATFIGTVDNTTWTQLIEPPSGGGGDVTKVGTPVDNEIGVWTGDGTLEGDTNLQWDGTNLALTGTTHLVLPQTNDAVTPTLAFGDGDSGFYEIADDNIGIAIAGSGRYIINAAGMGGRDGAAGFILDEAATATNPTVVPNRGDLDSGLGSDGQDILTIVTGGVEAMRFTEVSSAIIQAVESNVGLTADVGSAQGNGVITSTYNVYSTVGTTGDAATLPSSFVVGTQIYIKNDGANSMDVFPASGDDAGAGTDTVVAVASGDSKTFIATAADATWTELVVAAVGLGDVTKVGTPVNNEIGVWTGDGTLEGDTNLTWNGTTLANAATNGTIQGGVASSGAILNEAASDTNPTLIPRADDLTTGIGASSTGQFSMISSGAHIMRLHAGGLNLIPSTGQILLPIQNDAVTPTLGFGDGNTGLYESADNNLVVATAGAARFQFEATGFFGGVIANGPAMSNVAAMATVPTLLPDRGDINSGIGRSVADAVSIIAGGVEMLRLVETGTSTTDQLIIGPAGVIGAEATPSLAFGDGDTGFFEGSDDVLKVSIAGTEQFAYFQTFFQASVSGGARMSNVDATATVPVHTFNVDINTGIGSGADDELALIAGAIEGLRLTELNSGVVQAPAADVAITAFATGGQASAVALKQSYNVVSVCATSGDSVKLPAVFAVNSIITIKNDGAASCDVFPASGDDLGKGANLAQALASGASITYLATAANATWTPFADHDPLLLGDGTKTNPTYSFGDDPDTGMYTSFDGVLAFSAAGVEAWKMTGDLLAGFVGNGPQLRNRAATETIPTLIPHTGDPTTGIGANAATPTNLSLIASGFEAIRCVNTAGVDQVIIHPGAVINDPATPSLAFGDGDTGFYESTDDALNLSIAGTLRWEFSAVKFGSNQAGGPHFKNAGSVADPVIIPAGTDLDTGIAADGADRLAIIVGGISAVDYLEVNSGVLESSEANVGLTANANSSQGDSPITTKVNVYSTVVTTGDAVTLPSVFLVGTEIWVINDGANAMDVFPATGDDAGSGTNIAISVAAGDSQLFIGTVQSATWTQSTVAGSGDVTKVGTPVDNEIGVWTGDGTIEGDTNLQWDGTNLALTGTTHLVLPQTNDAATPTLAFGDGDTGFHEFFDDRLALALGGINFILFDGSVNEMQVTGSIKSANADGYALDNETASATNPTIRPRKIDVDSGFGSSAADAISVITGGIEALRFTELNSGVVQAPAADVAITALAGGGQGGAGVLKQSYNVISVAATTGDSVTLPAVFAVNSIVYIKNDGANSVDVFPASGDDLGQGANLAKALAAGRSTAYISTTANTTWTKLIDPLAGSGDVTKVGTPVNNEIGVWTGDGTLEGDSGLTWDGSEITANASQAGFIADESDGGGISFFRATSTNTADSGIQLEFNSTTGTDACLRQVTSSGVAEDIWIGFAEDAGVDIRHNDVTRLLTTANGVDITGSTSTGNVSGSFVNIRSATTELTGLTGASVTASALIPDGALIVGVTVRVTTTITGATSFDIGDGTDIDRWGATIGLTSGITTTGANFTSGLVEILLAAGDVVLTANASNFTAGAVRIVVYYMDLTAPTA